MMAFHRQYYLIEKLPADRPISAWWNVSLGAKTSATISSAGRFAHRSNGIEKLPAT
jgi:hypothetical protein